MPDTPAWLEITHGTAPLLVAFPHTGTDLTPELAPDFSSEWLARKDADHWVHLLYDFARDLGATTVRTRISRSVIDVNRDPSGASLYPGLTTTELCPTTTFDGEALYVPGREPDTTQSAVRRTRFFTPYHAALTSELTRLRTLHPHVVLYDAHSIRSHVPRLFAGTLPVLNLGDFDQRSCDSTLTARLEAVCRESQFSWITNGRFKGGWTTRHYGRPSEGVHALQMELADRGYMHEPSPLSEANWPPPYDLAQAAAVRAVLRQVLQGCLEWTATQNKA